MPGVGKSALAVHWAHQVADRFPAGQLYVNLRGFDPSGSPLPPEQAIHRLLFALGIPSERIPSDVDATASMYRSVLAGRRLLILLDNARDAAQVRPLVPGSPGCLVLVTSRHALTGLVADGARQLDLEVLSVGEAREFLARRIGPEWVAAAPDAVADLVAACGRLPLALAVVAARAAARPALPPSSLAAELHERSRLDALDGGDPATSVSAVFSWSYRQLSPETARMFRLLGLHCGPDVSLAAAASLAGISRDRARKQLAELHSSHLIVEYAAGRYAFHDLVRTYAAHLADTEPERHAATQRMLDHYLHSAYGADRLTKGYWRPIALDPIASGVEPEVPADSSLALDWLAAEEQTLVAAVHRAVAAGFDSQAWQLARTIEEFLHRRGRWRDLIVLQTEALDAAQRAGDPTGVAFAHGSLGVACNNLGRDDQAERHLRTAHDLWAELGDATGRGIALLNLGELFVRLGDYPAALRIDREAITVFESADDRAGQARALNNLGWHHALAGEYRATLEHCEHAANLLRTIGDRAGEAYAWDSVGYACHHLGDHQKAISCYERTVGLSRDTGDLAFQAVVLDHLGDAHAAAGEPATAHDRWQQAADILEDMHHPDAEQLRDKLATH
ncbi:tetratricopeptide repeat protein [Kribbella sp. CA-245084]|uniref:tetratricopeptide repeat protein n=1 Tax=Kribbella sp. CA-245084 TaxID=3239940 RepID=UPI003D8B96E1